MKSRIDRYWYLILVVILFVGSGLRLTGYNYQLPFHDSPLKDEGVLWADTLVQMGELGSTNLIYPGYPPGITIIESVAERIAERITGKSFWDAGNTAIAIVRFWAAITGVLTAVALAFLAKELAGNFAGLFVPAIWLLLPNPNLQTVREMPMAWVLLFATLSLYCSVRAVNRLQPGFAVASVIAGSMAVIFRYTEAILFFPAIVAIMWGLVTDGRRWLNTLFAVLAIIIGFALIGWFGFVTSYHSALRENAITNILRLFDWSAQVQNIEIGISQIGIPIFVFILIVGIGTTIYIREEGSKKLTVGWFFIIGYGILSVVLIQEYMTDLHLANRYVTPFSIPLSVLTGVGLVKITNSISSMKRGKWIGQGAMVIAAVVWLISLLSQSLALDADRIRPDTHAALINWSALNLGKGTLLVDTDLQDTFSKIYGGYTGDYRIYIKQPFQAHTLAEWRQEDVNYLVYSEDSLTQLRNANPSDLSQMLLINQFPPPGSTEQWQSAPVYVFRLWNSQYPRDDRFVNGTSFRGYDISSRNVRSGDTIQLNLYWNAATPPLGNYNVFLHLTPLADPTKLVAQADGAPAGISRPMLSWTNPGETLISPPFQLNIPELTKPGCYQLSAGLYNYETGQRLPLATGQDSVALTSICVNAAEF